MRHNSKRNDLIMKELERGLTYEQTAIELSRKMGTTITTGVVGNVARRAFMRDGHVEGRTPGEAGSGKRLRKPVVRQEDVLPLPAGKKVSRYILTAAQNNTPVDTRLARNLETLAAHYGATIMVGKYVYRVDSKNAEVLPEYRYAEEGESRWDPWVEKHDASKNILLAPDLIWEGMLNALPTATNPLAGFESHGRGRSLIFPHAKQEMRTLSRHREDNIRYNFTTGCVTVSKYVNRKAGIKAQFHHILGALLVEVDASGDWWARQLNDSKGQLRDLDLRVQNGRITKGCPAAGITIGDLHLDQIDPDSARALDGLLGFLKPKVEYYHDALDFRRSHYNCRDSFKTYLQHINDEYLVEPAVSEVAEFLGGRAKHAKVIAVTSNHDMHLTRWLDEVNPKTDLPENALYYHRLMAVRLEHALRTGKDNNMFAAAARLTGKERIRDVVFLDEDVSNTCEGIECGMHGHRGVAGSRGSPLQHTKLGTRSNIGHSHSPGIWGGVYVAGTVQDPNPDYSTGPTNWAPGHIIIYPGGKRTIVCQRAGKLWATQKI